MYIVTYDISNTKLRKKFSRFLLKHGRRLQMSVYEIQNSPRILRNIKHEVDTKYQPEFAMTDSILILPVCKYCKSNTLRYGYSVLEEEEVVFM